AGIYPFDRTQPPPRRYGCRSGHEMFSQQYSDVPYATYPAHATSGPPHTAYWPYPRQLSLHQTSPHVCTTLYAAKALPTNSLRRQRQAGAHTRQPRAFCPLPGTLRAYQIQCASAPLALLVYKPARLLVALGPTLPRPNRGDELAPLFALPVKGRSAVQEGLPPPLANPRTSRRIAIDGYCEHTPYTKSV